MVQEIQSILDRYTDSNGVIHDTNALRSDCVDILIDKTGSTEIKDCYNCMFSPAYMYLLGMRGGQDGCCIFSSWEKCPNWEPLHLFKDFIVMCQLRPLSPDAFNVLSQVGIFVLDDIEQMEYKLTHINPDNNKLLTYKYTENGELRERVWCVSELEEVEKKLRLRKEI